MKFIRRFWAPLLVAGLIPLLIALAMLQLRWIGEIGERERFRLTQGLLATAGQLASGFQSEIGIIPSVFHIDREEFEASLRNDDWSDFKDRWEVWGSYAIDPSIVSAIHIYREGDDFQSARLWTWDNQRFTSAISPELAAAFASVTEKRRLSGNTADTVELNAGEEAYLIPLMPPNHHWLVIVINRTALVESFIPILAERYLYGKTDYLFRIVDREIGKTVYLSDAKINEDLFSKLDLSFPLLGSDFRIIVREIDPKSDIPPGIDETDRLAPALGILRTRRESFTAFMDTDRRTEGYMQPIPRLFDDRTKTRWVLEAVHRKGSLAAAVRSGMIRSAVISSGILVVLGAALVFLAYSTRRKQELAERQNEFIASITHELKTPLAVIRSAADNLADGVIREAEKTTRYGGMIRNESGRLTDMIDRLLIYARIGDGKPLVTTAFDFGKLCERVVESYRDELTAAKFRVEIQLKDDIIVAGDASAIELSVGNIITNALKHARDGAFLGIDLRTEQKKKRGLYLKHQARDWAVLSIRDRGPGVPRRERRLVFEPFYRGERAQTKQTPGSGLGLNIVKRIIMAHGGRLNLESQGDLGTAFVIRLPLETSDGR